MIRQLHIQGFQAHRDLVIDLDPHITTITGVTDTGKSSVLRALAWLVFNRPTSDRFINHDAKQAAVSVTIDGVGEVSRTKGDGVNTYKIPGHTFEAFGSEVPEEVAKMLNLTPVNFQRQLDNHFWFCETPGEVSRRINEIINLSIIDNTLANLASAMREANAAKAGAVVRVDAAKTRRAGLKSAREMDAELREVESLQATAKAAFNRTCAMELVVGDVAASARSRKRARAMHADAMAVEAIGSAWDQRRKKLAALADLVGKMQALREHAMRPLPKPAEFDRLTNLGSARNTARSARQSLQALLGAVQNMEIVRCLARQKLREVEKELKRKMGSQCRLCGQKIPS